jgi:S-adenosylmethionine/arginine decarboxylase-like enzyme
LYNTHVKNIVSQIKTRNPSLKDVEIEGILYLLRSQQDLTSADLIRLTGLPKETLRVFKSSISNLLVKPEKEIILLKPEFIKQLDDADLKPYRWSLLEYTDKNLEDNLREIRRKHGLEPKREYDQWFATVNTSIAKALVLKDKGLAEGKNIALLGDDDLVSVVLGLMGGDNRITVFDIDKEILITIEAIISDLGIKNVQTRYLDVRKEVLQTELGKYDVVIMDPPYTKTGTAMFLNAGVQLLSQSKQYEGSYIFLYYGNSFKTPEKALKVQEIISMFNLLIEDKIDKFSRYHGAESIGSASSLYILKTTPFTAPVEDLLDIQGFYTFEGQKEEKFPFVDHYTAKVYNVPVNIVESKKAMQKVIGDFCRSHKLKVVDTKITQFKGKGLTFTYVLSNSNLLVHTWPELRAVHLDLVTCSPVYNKGGLAPNIARLFNTKNIELKRIE